jgi:hypothetical protein
VRFVKRHDFRRAVQLYSVEIDYAPSAELFSNRSAANSALEHFSCAARDAEEALLLRPDWSKAYFRLAVAHTGRKNFGAALKAASKALSLSPDDKSIQDLHSDVERKYLGLSDAESISIDLQLTECWPHVMFKDRVVVIYPVGGFDYCTISDAFSDCLEKYETKFTLILRPGTHRGCILAVNKSLVDGLIFQVLGWNDAASVDKHPRSELAVDKEASHLVLVEGNVVLHVQRIVFNSKIAGETSRSSHCIAGRGGSEAFVEHCFFRTSSNFACCSVEDPKTKLDLRNCMFKSVWSAVLVINEAVFCARGCKVTNSHRAGVEIRTLGRAVIEDCTFDRCNSQAVVLCNGGGQLQLTRCVVSHCGNKGGHHSSVLVETGTACLRDCTVKDCNADAVLLQQAVGRDDPPPVLLMEGCRLERNHSGCSIHVGSGVISRNTIRSHVGHGVLIRHVSRGKKIFVRGNTLDGNGNGCGQDVIIQGKTLFQESIVFESSNSCSALVMSDASAANFEASVRAKVDALRYKT